MPLTSSFGVRAVVLVWAGFVLGAAEVRAQTELVDFDSQRWNVSGADVVQHLGRKALAGIAYLEDLDFHNGVIEVDVAVAADKRSYPGIIFRMQSESDYERFYIRPHRAPLYPDALQYTPVFSGVACWQLYNGPGYNTSAIIPTEEWVRLRLEIHGTQAGVYLNGADQPSLEIADLKHGASHGSIGLMGPRDGTAYFSNFSYAIVDTLDFNEPTAVATPPEMLADWAISKRFDAARINAEAYPEFLPIFYAQWQKVAAEPPGLLNLSRHVGGTPTGPDCVWARTFVQSDRKQTVRLTFGYSDDVTMFLNGKKLFTGRSGYRSRDPSFLGVVGLHDSVYLPLEAGLNEVFLMVTERFGGWGFICKADRTLDAPVKHHDLLAKVWETPPEFKIPESALYDRERDVVYVTSFDKVGRRESPTGFISKLKLDGTIEELKWVTDLDGPCGMALHNGSLFVAESGGRLTEIDTASGTTVRRSLIPESTFLNDVTADERGIVYVTDSTRGDGGRDIYRCEDGECEAWLAGDEVHRANGLLFADGRLLVGSTGHGSLKTVSLDDRRVRTVTCLGAGVVDGIRPDGEGNYLVSRWEGKVFRVSPSGDVVEILDTIGSGLNTADFEYIPEKRLLIIPTFLGNNVVAYRMTQS